MGATPVFVSRFVQTHVRVYRSTSGIEAELWEHPRAAKRRLFLPSDSPSSDAFRLSPVTRRAESTGRRNFALSVKGRPERMRPAVSGL
jgi:hypothetical protein